MPTRSKLDSLRDERSKLAKKGTRTPSDDKRMSTLERLIREEQRKTGSGFTAPAKRAYNDASKLGSSGRGYRSVDSTSQANAMSRDQIRSAFGMDPLQGAFPGLMTDRLDANGDPTGRVGINPELASYRFGKGGTDRYSAMGSAIGSQTPGNRTVSVMNGMSAQQILDFYYSMNDAELTKFQHELVEAGLLEKPQLGFRDPATTESLGLLMKAWVSEPNNGIQDILSNMKRANASRLDGESRKMLGEGTSGTGVVSDEIANIQVTDAATLDSLLDRVSQNIFGSLMDPVEKQAILSQLQEEERQHKTQVQQSDFDARTATSKKTAADASGSTELNAFMDALIGQESGGNPNAVNADSGAMGIGQIMPENWGPWAAEAGADSSDFSEANQRRIIKYKLAQYYQSYGNWYDVALAWYGGAGGVQRVKSGGGYGDEDGYPSLRAYADQVLAKMGANTSSKMVEGAAPNLTVNVTESLTDAETRAEDKLKRLDPARYLGSQYAKQAEGFFSLLNGVN